MKHTSVMLILSPENILFLIPSTSHALAWWRKDNDNNNNVQAGHA